MRYKMNQYDFMTRTLENIDNAEKLVGEYPFLNELFKEYGDYYEDFFADAEEIGSSDVNICLDNFFKDNNTTWEEIQPLFKKSDLSMKWFFAQHTIYNNWNC